MEGESRRRLLAVLVASGGFLGTIARYGVDVLAGTGMAGTLTVNVLGAAALGVVVSTRGRGLSATADRFLATGFLSSFTTYSTFVVETVAAAPVAALAYVVGTYGLGFAAAAIALAAMEDEKS